MSDREGERAPASTHRIDPGDPEAVRWWCGRLGVSEGELREAVGAVGTSPAAVAHRLGRWAPPPPPDWGRRVGGGG